MMDVWSLGPPLEADAIRMAERRRLVRVLRALLHDCVEGDPPGGRCCESRLREAIRRVEGDPDG